MCKRFARILVSDTYFVIILRYDTDFGVRCTRSTRILLSDTNFGDRV